MTNATIRRGCGHREHRDIYANGMRRVKAEIKRIQKEEPCPECGHIGGPEEQKQEQKKEARVRTATGQGIPQKNIKANRYPGTCHICGGHVPAGKGKLFYIDPFEAYEVSGWIVEHMDRETCQAEQQRKAEMLKRQAQAYCRD